MVPELVYHADYVVELPAGHRFPMPKYRALRDLLERRGLISQDHCCQPTPAGRSWLERVHQPDYIAKVLEQRLSAQEERRLGLPMTPALARRACASVGGSILTVELALKNGLAINLAGGSHHAFASFGSGFCVFNDVATACAYFLAQGLLERILVVDLDVHQGDGTASILEGCSGVCCLSLHCRTNFPAKKQFSSIDVALEPDTDDRVYLKTLDVVVPSLLERIRPGLVIYVAGVDPHKDDKLGRLALTDQGLAEREARMLSWCQSRQLPLAVVLGGGYADNVEDIAERHAILHAVARDIPHW